MQINPPPVQPLTDNPIGELLLETVKNAPILPVSLMEAVATYVNYQSRPVMTIAGMPVVEDPTLGPNEFRFEHPDGRKQGFRLFRGKK